MLQRVISYVIINDDLPFFERLRDSNLKFFHALHTAQNYIAAKMNLRYRRVARMVRSANARELFSVIRICAATYELDSPSARIGKQEVSYYNSAVVLTTICNFGQSRMLYGSNQRISAIKRSRLLF